MYSRSTIYYNLRNNRDIKTKTKRRMHLFQFRKQFSFSHVCNWFKMSLTKIKFIIFIFFPFRQTIFKLIECFFFLQYSASSLPSQHASETSHQIALIWRESWLIKSQKSRSASRTSVKLMEPQKSVKSPSKW